MTQVFQKRLGLLLVVRSLDSILLMFVDAEDIRRGLENDEFLPFFQPLVVLRTGQLAGFEVLARWQHPKAGLLLPDEFIAIAESNGLIAALTRMVVGKAFSAARAIPEPLTLSLNISPLQLRDLELPKLIQNLAQASSFSARRIIIEVTESALIHNLELTQAVARELRAMGCSISLDDFGTGYSSLLHLQSLPFSELKVDRSFVSSMTSLRDSRKIVAAVVGLGQSLGMVTVAEGVESGEQAELLLWLGCELGQGWLFGEPAPAVELAAVLAMPRDRISTSRSKNGWKEVSWSMLPSHRLTQLQAIYDGAPVGLAFLDRELRYVSLNQRLADFNERPVEEHLGRCVSETVPELFAQFEPYVRRALQGEAISGIEVTKTLREGQGQKTFLLSYQPALDEAGEVTGVSVAVSDITERKVAEAALRESEDHYQYMVELNPQILWMLDADGRALGVSSRWEQVTGMSMQTSTGRRFLDAVHPDDRQSAHSVIETSIRTGEPIDIECRLQSSSGGWRWIRSRGAPRRDQSGKIIRWYGSTEDIHDRKTAEEALRKNETLPLSQRCF